MVCRLQSTLRIVVPTFVLTLTIPSSGAFHINPICNGRIVRYDRNRSFVKSINDRRTLRNLSIQNDVTESNEDENDVEKWESLSAELLMEDEDDGLNDGEWLSDREKARIKLERQQQTLESILQKSTMNEEEVRSNSGVESDNDPSYGSSSSTVTTSTGPTSTATISNRPSPYTDEEEEIISAMGGKSKQRQRRREPGFLGDSTLVEICSDYSVPISYLADVLCMWDVPVPINIYDKLGDLVTGEQAFAIVEAVNTLDVAALHDRYSNTNIQQLCYEWDIDIQAAFELTMKENWSLPFGVQTCLRVEQERELLRVLGSQSGVVDIPDDEDDEYY